MYHFQSVLKLFPGNQPARVWADRMSQLETMGIYDAPDPFAAVDKSRDELEYPGNCGYPDYATLWAALMALPDEIYFPASIVNDKLN